MIMGKRRKMHQKDEQDDAEQEVHEFMQSDDEDIYEEESEFEIDPEEDMDL